MSLEHRNLIHRWRTTDGERINSIYFKAFDDGTTEIEKRDTVSSDNPAFVISLYPEHRKNGSAPKPKPNGQVKKLKGGDKAGCGGAKIYLWPAGLKIRWIGIPMPLRMRVGLPIFSRAAPRGVARTMLYFKGSPGCGCILRLTAITQMVRWLWRTERSTIKRAYEMVVKV